LDNKAPDAFRTISEVADELDLPQHVLRFWESRFREIKPMKRGGGRRFYRPDDIDLLRGIRHLLYGEGYTIRGVQRILREQGPKFVQVVWQEGAPQPPHGASEDDGAGEEIAGDALEPVDEPRGLRGRLSSLIGRDFSERAEEPREPPPMQSAPVPRIESRDRAIHAPDQPEPIEPVAPVAPPAIVAPLPPQSAPPAPSGLSREDLGKLRTALADISECRRLLDAAVSRD